jgi:hypothetical protein
MLLEQIKPWGVAPHPTLLLKKEGRKLFYCGYAAEELGSLVLGKRQLSEFKV